MVAVYCDKRTSRLEYALDTVFRDFLKCGYRLFTDSSEFLEAEIPGIAYSQNNPGAALFIKASPLLFENNIRKQQPEILEWKGRKVLFPVKHKEALLPFDPLACIFYHITRYEEYLPHHVKDIHGRFKAENSILFRSGMLQEPIVDILMLEIKNRVIEKFPAYRFPEQEYSFQPTYDIDMAFAHLGKGFLRSIGGFAKLFLKLQPREIRGQVKTLLGLQKDPFDNFDLQKSLHFELGLKAVYFVNLGDYSRYDKNISHENRRLRSLLKETSEHAELGIHPSYYSDQDTNTLKTEIGRLEGITGKAVSKSRQHFLKLDFPETYRRLIDAGISEDYSMGYASQIGFRAGTSSPFYFYDLEKEEKTKLKVHPFAFMDTTFLDYLDVAPGVIPDLTKPLIEPARKLKIPLMAIWHNYALADDQDRFAAYEEILREAEGE